MFKRIFTAITACLITVSIILAFITQHDLKKSMEQEREIDARSLFLQIKSNLQGEYDSLSKLRVENVKQRQKQLKAIVDAAVATFNNFDALCELGLLSREQARTSSFKSIEAMNQLCDVFILDLDFNVIYFKDKSQIGSSWASIKDVRGNESAFKIIRDIPQRVKDAFYVMIWNDSKYMVTFTNEEKSNLLIGARLSVQDIDQNEKQNINNLAERLQSFARESASITNAYLFIFDDALRIVSHPFDAQHEQVVNLLSQRPLLEELKDAADQEQAVEVHAVNGKGEAREQIIFSTYFKPLGWRLAYAVPKAAIQSAGKKLQAKQLGILAVAILALAIVLFLLLRRMLQPVRSITKIIRDMERHKLELDAKDHQELLRAAQYKDETGVLARSFLSMHAELLQHTKELETQVAERTKDYHSMAEQALLMAKKAEQANVAKSTFLANMSHEIRSPLNVILGMASILDEEDKLPHQEKIIQMLEESGEHLLSLIEDILNFSKIEAGELKLESIAFDLHECIHSLAQEYALATRKKGLNFVLDLSNALPRHAQGDPTRLKQILQNLLSNAVKFTHDGRVSLTVAPGSAPGAIRFVVEDTGIGMPACFIEQLFHPFSQADSSTTRKYGGTGLGLAIVNRLVQRMNGVLEVRSLEGAGSTFTLELPLPTQDATTRVLPAQKTAETTGKPAASARILMADDDASNRMLVELLLKGSRYAVDCTSNGREALEAFQRGKYDLVLMDLEMPEMDGLESVRRMRAFETSHAAAPIPILALTAHAFQEHMLQAKQAGCNEFLTKPITRKTLLKALDVWTNDAR